MTPGGAMQHPDKKKDFVDIAFRGLFLSFRHAVKHRQAKSERLSLCLLVFTLGSSACKILRLPRKVKIFSQHELKKNSGASPCLQGNASQSLHWPLREKCCTS